MNVFFMVKKWPYHGCNSSINRSLSFTETLINSNKGVTLCSDDLSEENRQLVSTYPLNLLDINPRKIAHSFNDLTIKPNLFIFDSFESEQKYSAILYNKWNKSPRILDINYLPRLAQWRKQQYSILLPNVITPPNAPMAPLQLKQILQENQIRSIQRSDYLLTGSQFIFKMLQKFFPNKKISYFPCGYLIDEFMNQIQQLQYRPFQSRKNFVFLGNFDKQENRDTVEFLIDKVWPLIKDLLPSANLHIYGSGNDRELRVSRDELKKKGVYFKGKMKQIEDLSKYKAFLAPVLYGGGLHYKIVQSFFCHIPVVTTPIGAQGNFFEIMNSQAICPNQSQQLASFQSQRQFTSTEIKQTENIKNYYKDMIFSSKINQLSFGGSCNNFTLKNFVENAVELYTNEEMWNKKLEIGQKTIMRNYNENQVLKIIKKAIIKAQKAVYENRKGEYEEEWRRYSRSQQFQQKLKS